MKEPKLLTVGQAARRLGVHPSTIKRWCDSGELHAERLPPSGHRRIATREIDRFRRSGARRKPQNRGPFFAIRPMAIDPDHLLEITAIDRRRTASAMAASQ